MLRLARGLALAALVASCSPPPAARPPRRPVVTRDDDRSPRPFRCVTEAGRERCHPARVLATEGADATFALTFGPLSRLLDARPEGPAGDVNALDEVVDSAWFENRAERLARLPLAVAEGPCDELLSRRADEIVSATVVEAAARSSSLVLTLEGEDRPEIVIDVRRDAHPAGASAVVASRLLHAAGYRVPCVLRRRLGREAFTAAPGAFLRGPTGARAPLDQRALVAMLPEGDVIDAAFVVDHGVSLGPVAARGVRDDDPADVVPHERRRSLRGLALVGAFLDLFDERPARTEARYLSADRARPSSSPGRVESGLRDLSLSLGAPRDGVALAGPFSALIGEGFDAASYQVLYRGEAQGRATPSDLAWAGRVLAPLDDAVIAAAIAPSGLPAPLAADLAARLTARRAAALRLAFSQRSALSRPRLAGRSLCATDLLVGARLASPGPYAARLSAGEPPGLSAYRELSADSSGAVCLDVPPIAPLPTEAGPLPPGDPLRHAVVTLTPLGGGPPLRVHLYDEGEGLELVAAERPAR